MMTQSQTQEDASHMIDICLSGFQLNKDSKLYERVCHLFLNQFKQGLTKRRPEEVCISITICPTVQKGNVQSNQSFIMGCLLYLFLKYRFLKVVFEVNPNPSKIDRQKNIILSVSNNKDILMSSEFQNKMAAYIEQKLIEHRQSFNFFGDIYMKFKELNNNKKNNEVLRLRSYFFTAQFYTQLHSVLSNRSIYLIKNTLYGFENTMLGDREYFNRILEQIRKIYVSTQVCINIPHESLMLLDKIPQTKSDKQAQSTEQGEISRNGIFKEFQGTTLQYLQKFVVNINGQASQILQIANFIKKTPNLAYLQLHHKLPNEVVVPGMEILLQSIIENTQFMKKVTLVKLRMQNIELELLQKLYVNCPFLVQLSLGVKFQHSIPETYEQQNNTNKEAIELERQKLILLQAFRLRNITLKNSQETAKLLLKKGYSFVSALQIIDCIEPICL